MGNKKSVDIVVNRSSKAICTIDVKGLADQYDWPADNYCIFDNPNHFYVLLTFDGKISDLQGSPSVWVILSNEIKQFIKQYTTRNVVSRSLIKSKAVRFRNAWNIIPQKSQVGEMVSSVNNFRCLIILDDEEVSSRHMREMYVTSTEND